MPPKGQSFLSSKVIDVWKHSLRRSGALRPQVEPDQRRGLIGGILASSFRIVLLDHMLMLPVWSLSRPRCFRGAPIPMRFAIKGGEANSGALHSVLSGTGQADTKICLFRAELRSAVQDDCWLKKAIRLAQWSEQPGLVLSERIPILSRFASRLLLVRAGCGGHARHCPQISSAKTRA